MKQGRATISGRLDGKVDPSAKAINPGAVANLGTMQGNHADAGDMPFKSTPMDAGRGYSAPGIASTTHKCGSQGKH
jgi:hypothetical protein